MTKVMAMKYNPDVQLAKNFKLNEFLYSADKEAPTPDRIINLYLLAQKLQALRDVVGPININSGFRGKAYNASINGHPNSFHMTGKAADIKFNFKGHTRDSMTKLLQKIGFTNVNFYWTKDRKSWVWLHVDIGKTWDGKPFYYRDLDSSTQKEIKL